MVVKGFCLYHVYTAFPFFQVPEEKEAKTDATMKTADEGATDNLLKGESKEMTTVWFVPRSAVIPFNVLFFSFFLRILLRCLTYWIPCFMRSFLSAFI